MSQYFQNDWSIEVRKQIPQSLRVLIEPAQTRQAGASWRKVGIQAWRPHGLMDRLGPGPHMVQFRTLPGATRPTGR